MISLFTEPIIQQIIQSRAAAIAETYTVNRAAWRAAAAQLRQPYWDWAVNIIPPPEVISLEKVIITTPNGQRTEVDNPFLRYTFHPIDPSFRSPFNQWSTTLRCPTSENSPDAESNVERMKKLVFRLFYCVSGTSN